MEISMWQDNRDCDYSSMVNGVSGVDVTVILLTIYIYYYSFLNIGL